MKEDPINSVEKETADRGLRMMAIDYTVILKL